MVPADHGAGGDAAPPVAPLIVPLIAAVVPAYNAADHIDAALGSILAQRGPFRLEVLVVDDGSGDDTAARAEAHPGVRVIRQANAGPSAARNRAIAETQAGLIAFLDADDLWPEGSLAALLALLESHPEAGLAFGDCRGFDAGGAAPRTQFELQGLDDGFFGHPLEVQDPYRLLLRCNFVPTGATLARRTCIEGAGGFDPARRRVEDLDLWLRMALCCPFVYTRRVCEHKRGHAANVSADSEAMTLDYIALVEAQRRQRPRELARRGIRIGPRLAREYSLVGDLRERRGDRPGARLAYAAALRAHPSPRPLYYWLRTLLPAGVRAREGRA
jgi:glycosyltransferase involved in cell wall biosynthesis